MVCEDQKEGVAKSRKALLTRSGRVYQGTFAICFLVQSHRDSLKDPGHTRSILLLANVTMRRVHCGPKDSFSL